MAKNRRTVDIPEGNVITIRNVYKAYDKQTAALNGISLDIRQGEFVFIVGDSGSGKSTLIKLLLRELRPTRGYINVLGYDLNRLPHRKIAKFRRNLGIVFQDFRLLKDRNIYENVAFAERIIQIPNSSIKRDVPNILATVGLANKYKNFPDQLSGGEQQRVALARALINHPYILLADEPTGNLDPRNSWEIMKLLERVNEEGTTVVVVTHNRVITMRQASSWAMRSMAIIRLLRTWPMRKRFTSRTAMRRKASRTRSHTISENMILITARRAIPVLRGPDTVRQTMQRAIRRETRALMLRMLMLAGEDEGEEARLFLSADRAE